MIFNFEIAILFLAITIWGCQPNPSPTPTPAPGDWQKIDAKGRFSFLIPPDIKPDTVQGIDSYIGQFQSSNMQINFDYGGHSDPLQYSDKSEYEETITKSDGRKAKLVTFHDPAMNQNLAYIAAIHFADLGDGQTKLTMWVYGKGREEQIIATKILQSIKFP